MPKMTLLILILRVHTKSVQLIKADAQKKFV